MLRWLSTSDVVCCDPAVGEFFLPIPRRGSDGPTGTQRSFTRMMFQPACVFAYIFLGQLASCKSGAYYLPNHVAHSPPRLLVDDQRETVRQSSELQNEF